MRNPDLPTTLVGQPEDVDRSAQSGFDLALGGLEFVIGLLECDLTTDIAHDDSNFHGDLLGLGSRYLASGASAQTIVEQKLSPCGSDSAVETSASP